MLTPVIKCVVMILKPQYQFQLLLLIGDAVVLQVDFSVAEVSLSNKPDWFLKLSPLGKVPVVTWKTGDAVNTV